MKTKTIAGTVCAGLLVSGCITATEPVRLKAGFQQQAMMRDGYSALLSKRAHSFVRVAFEVRSIGKIDRPAFRLDIRNTSNEPQDVIIDEIRAEQVTKSGTRPLKVYSFEDLVQELDAQVAVGQLAMLGAGVAVAALAPNSRSARRARDESVELAEDFRAAGNRKLYAYEANVLKDTSVLPHEKYFGYLYLEPPSGEDDAKKVYILHLRVGSDRHDIMIAQGRGPLPANAAMAMAQAPGGAPNLWQEWAALDQPVYAYAEPEQRVICTEPNGQVSLYSTLMCGSPEGRARKH